MKRTHTFFFLLPQNVMPGQFFFRPAAGEDKMLIATSSVCYFYFVSRTPHHMRHDTAKGGQGYDVTRNELYLRLSFLVIV